MSELNKNIKIFFHTYHLISTITDNTNNNLTNTINIKNKDYNNFDFNKFDGLIISNDLESDFCTDNINFELIKSYPKITTKDIKEESKNNLVNYLKSLIKNNIKILMKNYKEEFYLILHEYMNNLPNYLSKDQIIEIIYSDDFLGIDDILEILYINEEYKKFDEYVKLKKINEINFNSSIHSIQYFENKLYKFEELDSYTYFFYFSFGTLNFIEQVDWKKTLEPYIKDIINLLDDSKTKSIVLAGHSVGSIVL